MKITNIAPGPRGVNTKSGVVILAAGETRDLELEDGEAKSLSDDWFRTGRAAKADVDNATEADAAAKADADKKAKAEADAAAKADAK